MNGSFQLVSGGLLLALAGCAQIGSANSAGSTRGSATLDRTVLPPPAPAFAGRIAQSYKDSTPDWKPALPLAAPEGAPNVLVIVLDDVGYHLTEDLVDRTIAYGAVRVREAAGP